MTASSAAAFRMLTRLFALLHTGHCRVVALCGRQLPAYVDPHKLPPRPVNGDVFERNYILLTAE